ncbi:MAG: DUF5996 family protein [Steroidobacteraceae bacterium]
MQSMSATNASTWPDLPYDAWRDTAATLHLWLQIVGKISLMQCPWLNHSWHVALLVSARGLATRLLSHDAVSFQIEFDFIDHALVIRSTDGRSARVELKPQSTASFYRQVMKTLRSLDIPVAIRTLPNELPQPIPFDQDETHCAYDGEYARRYWRALVQCQRVFEEFRARFIGKSSPVHYFWGSADLAVTRFSGRRAPEHPGGVPNLPDWVTREAYSHEVSSAGFWAGGDQFPNPMFYSYAYPEPPGFASAAAGPATAHYDSSLREFVLPYEAVRNASAPDAVLLEFLQTTFDAAAALSNWDVKALTRAHAPNLR